MANMSGGEKTKKRKANSPIVNREKESRNEYNTANMDENDTQGVNHDQAGIGLGLDWDGVAGSNSSQSSRRGSTTSRDTFATVTSRSMQRKEKPVRESVFVTKKPEGAFRDEIVVELHTLDDQPFRGSITVREARKKIFEEILGFKQEDMASLILTYSRGPIATFKLVKPINIDMLESFQHFELKRSATVRGEERTSILKCMIRGIRTKQRVDGEGYTDTGMRWVKVEGCEFRVEKEQMIEWLSYFGEVKSEITEDTHGGSDDSADDLPPVGNGIYSVRMKLKRDMPQFVPMYGKRVRLYYRGIVKRCTNCFQPHQRSQCKNEKVMWAEYVRGFAEVFPEIPQNMYGKWFSLLGKPYDTTTNQAESKPVEKSSLSCKTKHPETEGKGDSSTQSQSGMNQKDKGNRDRGEDEESEEGIEDEETDDEDLINLLKKLRASGVSKKSIQKTLSGGSGKGKPKQRGRGGARGRGEGRGRGKN